VTRENPDNLLHFSNLKHIAVSPLNYKDKLDNPAGDTRSYLLGRAAHRCWLLGQATPIWDKGKRDLRNPEYAAAVATFGEKLPNAAEAKLIDGMVNGLERHPEASRIKRACDEFEKPLVWTRDGVECAGHLDMRGPRILAELKSSQAADMHIARFQWLALKKYHYTEQLAWYAVGDGMAEPVLEGPDDYPIHEFDWPESWIIAVESTRPHDVVCHRVSPLQLDKADSNIREWLATWRQCQAVNLWPGRSWDPVELDAEIEVGGMDNED
jgi:hypothetical protein